MADRKIVLDANIIIRATLGNKVVNLMQQAFDKIKFYAKNQKENISDKDKNRMKQLSDLIVAAYKKREKS